MWPVTIQVTREVKFFVHLDSFSECELFKLVLEVQFWCFWTLKFLDFLDNSDSFLDNFDSFSLIRSVFWILKDLQWRQATLNDATSSATRRSLPRQAASFNQWAKISGFKIGYDLAAQVQETIYQSQAANCELSFKLFKSFRILASWIPRKFLVIFSCRSQVLSAFKQWNRQAFEGIVLAFRCSTHLNITLLSVYVIKSSLARQLVSNCMHVLSLALLSGLRLFLGFLQVTFLSA